MDCNSTLKKSTSKSMRLNTSSSQNQRLLKSRKRETEKKVKRKLSNPQLKKMARRSLFSRLRTGDGLSPTESLRICPNYSCRPRESQPDTTCVQPSSSVPPSTRRSPNVWTNSVPKCSKSKTALKSSTTNRSSLTSDHALILLRKLYIFFISLRAFKILII